MDENNNNQSLGAAFQAALSDSGVSRAELARLLGVSGAVVNHWRSRGVPAEYALVVADVLGVPVESISKIQIPRTNRQLFVAESAADYQTGDGLEPLIRIALALERIAAALEKMPF